MAPTGSNHVKFSKTLRISTLFIYFQPFSAGSTGSTVSTSPFNINLNDLSVCIFAWLMFSFHNQVPNCTFLTLYNESTSNEIDYIKSSKVVINYLVLWSFLWWKLKRTFTAPTKRKKNSKLNKQANRQPSQKLANPAESSHPSEPAISKASQRA